MSIDSPNSEIATFTQTVESLQQCYYSLPISILLTLVHISLGKMADSGGSDKFDKLTTARETMESMPVFTFKYQSVVFFENKIYANLILFHYNVRQTILTKDER